MIYNDHMIQGDLTEFNSIMVLALETNVKDICLVKSPGIPEVRYETLSDGWYTGYQIAVPTLQWLDYTIDTCPETLSSYDTIYYIADGNLFKYNYWDNTTSNIDPVEIIKNPNGVTNISISYIDFFITEKLENELLSLFELSINKNSCKKTISCCCSDKKDDNSNIIEKRNQLQNIIELINYYIECGNYDSALDLLNEYNNCFELSDDLCCRKK